MLCRTTATCRSCRLLLALFLGLHRAVLVAAALVLVCAGSVLDDLGVLGIAMLPFGSNLTAVESEQRDHSDRPFPACAEPPSATSAWDNLQT